MQVNFTSDLHCFMMSITPCVICFLHCLSCVLAVDEKDDTDDEKEDAEKEKTARVMVCKSSIYI